MIDANRFDAISFDVFGTVPNWEPEIAEFLGSWTAESGLELTHEELLAAYDRLRQPLQDLRPALRYPEVLKQTLDAMADQYRIDTAPEVRERFGDTAATHSPFADSIKALADLIGLSSYTDFFRMPVATTVSKYSTFRS